MKMEQDLSKKAPLAQRMRPRNLDEFVGQDHIVGEGKYLNRLLKGGHFPSLLFYGPPGIGKTSLAEIMAKESGKAFVRLSAVTSNVKELREVLHGAIERLKMKGTQTILFLDEIHRFNKSQQDVLLPYIEKGQILLMGATTENPYFYVNKALLSRLQVLDLHPLEEKDLEKMIDLALSDGERGYGKKKIRLEEGSKEQLIRLSNGDGRSLYNGLEIAVLSSPIGKEGEIVITPEDLENSMMTRSFRYDRDGNAHYDTISAFIKSIRGSDPDAALYYLAKMIQSGEAPEYIGRRLIISASEDISNADPHALPLAIAAFEAVRIVGMPEGRIPLAQATTYLASAPKSNRSYVGINEALGDVKKGIGEEIPAYLRDKHQPLPGEELPYKYPHSYPEGFVTQRYFPLDMEEKTYYKPVQRGYEKNMEQYLSHIENLKEENRGD